MHIFVFVTYVERMMIAFSSCPTESYSIAFTLRWTSLGAVWTVERRGALVTTTTTKRFCRKT